MPLNQQNKNLFIIYWILENEFFLEIQQMIIILALFKTLATNVAIALAITLDKTISNIFHDFKTL